MLPPGFSEAEFRRVLSAFASAVGAAHVLGPEDDRSAWLDPYAAFGNAEEFASSGVVMPGTVEELQAALRIANEARIPLWTVSRGRNLGYGGAAPRVRGSVILDLGRMNRILEVSEEFAYALVEPGVTFFDLYEHIKERGLKLWLSVPALGWGSVVGNALERGFGYTPYGDHAAQICGLEVALANGELVRTGMGAMDGAKTWQMFKGSYGPSAEGLFLQSNLGVVTKLGLWLMPQPEGIRTCEVRFQREEDLEAAIDAIGPLRRREIIQNNAVLANATRLGASVAPRSRWYDGEGAMPKDVIDRIARELGLGWWNLRFSLYGDEAMLDARFRVIEREFGKIPGAEILSNTIIGGPDGLYAWDIGGPGEHQAGVPSLFALQVLKFRGEDCGHIGFSPIVAPKGSEAVRVYRQVKARAAEHGIDYFGGFTCNVRHINHIFLIIYDKHDPKQTNGADAMFKALVADAAAGGVGEYRAHLAHMDLVGHQYAWGGHALRRFNETLKHALDPNGILSPGKQGIWPKGVRP